MTLSYASNPAFTGFFKPTRFEGEVYDCEVWGDIPDDLVGTYYRMQPDPEYPLLSSDDYPLSGDGHLSMFRFVGAGHVDFRSRYVKTERLEADRKAHKTLTSGGASANQNVVWHGGKLLALGEQGAPVAVDPHTLATQGPWTFGGKLAGRDFGARPTIDPRTGEMIAYATRGDEIAILTIDRSGRLVHEVAFKAPYAALVAGVAITPNHVVVPLTGLVASPDRAKAGKAPWAWDANRPAVVAVIKRGGSAGDVRWFKGPARYARAVLAAAEDGDKLVLTLPGADANPDPLYPNFDGTPVTGAGANPSIRRWTFDLAGKDNTFKEETVFAGAGFAIVDPRTVGRSARYAFKGTADPAQPFDETKGGALKGRVVNTYQKLDLSTGQATASYFVGDVQGLQECVFVPRSAVAAEGDGYLIGVVNNYGDRKTDLVVVDASALEKGAIATVKLPFRLRPGTHGVWAPVGDLAFPVFSA